MKHFVLFAMLALTGFTVLRDPVKQQPASVAFRNQPVRLRGCALCSENNRERN